MDQWIFFHCIRQNRIEPYVCKKIPDIFAVKVPNIEAHEYLIPLCVYTPKSMYGYFLTKKIQSQVQITIADN
jgi:hypothetical protein